MRYGSGSSGRGGARELTHRATRPAARPSRLPALTPAVKAPPPDAAVASAGFRTKRRPIHHVPYGPSLREQRPRSSSHVENFRDQLWGRLRDRGHLLVRVDGTLVRSGASSGHACATSAGLVDCAAHGAPGSWALLLLPWVTVSGGLRRSFAGRRGQAPPRLRVLDARRFGCFAAGLRCWTASAGCA